MKKTSNRISSIDLLRGLVMMLMALDHVRDFFHIGSMHNDPLDLQTTTPLLFFTRWVTHYCAPVFIFLAGISAYIFGQKKTKKQLSIFLLTRGLWLIVIEFTVIVLGWSFDPFYHTFVFQVIAAIGMCLIILGLMIWLPYLIILSTGILITCFHNLIDQFEIARNGNVGFIWDILHHGGFNRYEFLPNHSILIIYPFVPWAALMMLGYCTGKIFTFESAQRKKILLSLGFGMIAMFFAIRLINTFGDSHHWSLQNNFLFTLLSFIDVSKYPPSLLYVLMTIGPALIFLALAEHIQNKFSAIVEVFGRVPFFYYIAHIYLIHFLTVILFFVSGHQVSEIQSNQSMFLFRAPDMGFGLAGVYVIWIFVLIVLYPVCKKFSHYKQTHQSWWLKYL
ncbi:MAG: heparan-alpha-glucosaminide N-acetyltransferase domain-containing protein [Bacteroidota bacterium]